MGKNPAIDDDCLLATIEFFINCGVRDAAGGGVSPVTIAEGHHAERSTISEHCSALADAGELVRVTGIGIESNRPRPSFLPADHPDAMPDDDAVPERGVTG